ncbi:MAG: GNAT family N-acetyltransferase, partial [Myxococcales bacterium]
PPPASAIGVEAVTDATAPDWLATLVEGFGQPDGSGPGLGVDDPSREVLAAIFRQFLRTPGFRGYLARVDGHPAGAASLRLDLGLAQLCGATTLPAFRRRGVQSALLDARLAVARAAGCDLAVVTTSPGSASQANARRRGFELLYTRALLVKTPPT